MLKAKMYVRCPIDEEDMDDPRVFAMGQIVEVDKFADIVRVILHDPFKFKKYYEEIPKRLKYPSSYLERCEIFKGTIVEYDKKNYKVIECSKQDKNGWYYYYIQNLLNKDIEKVREDVLKVPFTNGRINPTIQLERYEFQNPCWYLGRNIVSKTMHVLENSIYGFKSLAGCKIFLMPHQLKTIMRCLESNKIRYMLADEVGMGKTIEAISILKIYLEQKTNQKVLIIVPKALIEQWKIELFFKFAISVGKDEFENEISIRTSAEIDNVINEEVWDFVIVDEVHKLLENLEIYKKFHKLSEKSVNILLLSATPVQQKEEQYLNLLRLVLPQKYDNIDLPSFIELVEKQREITKIVYIILMNLEEYLIEVSNVLENEGNPCEDKNCKALFEELNKKIPKLIEILNDNIFTNMANEFKFDEEDFGRNTIQEMMAYVCNNYQIEKNIIRNRRKVISENLPKRELVKCGYDLDPEKNTYEFSTYKAIEEWISLQNIEANTFKDRYVPLLMSFFSSPWAFINEIEKCESKGFLVDNKVKDEAILWKKDEEAILRNKKAILDDPGAYSSRFVKVINYIFEDAYDKKVVLFTNYSPTFKVYQKVLLKYFDESEVAFFKKTFTNDELELNVYRFQNDKTCRIILCDESGGEGRNFQNADEVLHIDLPWNANTIEQRIGRLDRIGREAEKSVKSVVFFVNDSLEEALLNFWDEGLNVFDHSLSGLEIIMDEITKKIIDAVVEDFKYGITNAISDAIEVSKNMEKEIRKEQRFDTATFIYASMYKKIKKLVKRYTKNENEIFGNTMLSWASLAGMRGHRLNNDCVSFDASSFSINSAKNTMLIPPNWEAYINKKGSKFISKVQELYLGDTKDAKILRRIITGTFDRKSAIENDYLHFFAPGDEIFDCITENALKSSKGQVTAMAVAADFNWSGLVFTWVVEPNLEILLENNVPLIMLSTYRNYLASNEATIIFPFCNTEDLSEKELEIEVNKILERPPHSSKSGAVHLGRRSNEHDMMGINHRYGVSNLEWFKKKYPKDLWEDLVKKGQRVTKEKAKKEFKKKNDILGAKIEMVKELNSMKAKEKYYGLKTDGFGDLKKQDEIILKALNNSKLVLESACYIRMVKS